jgi:hypothetical protein
MYTTKITDVGNMWEIEIPTNLYIKLKLLTDSIPNIVSCTVRTSDMNFRSLPNKVEHPTDSIVMIEVMINNIKVKFVRYYPMNEMITLEIRV